MKRLFSLAVILFSTGSVFADEATLQNQIDTLKARVEVLETKAAANPTREYICAAVCTFWWQNDGYPREHASIRATGDRLVTAYDALSDKCSANYKASGYQRAKWYLATPNGSPALPTTPGICQLVE